MKKGLFKIYDFVKRNDSIIVQIEDNNYTDNSIVIPVHSFIQYLLRHDLLYYEHNDYSTGQLVTKTYHLTFDNYWEEMERENKERDLYDYIVCTCMDFTKAIDNIIFKQNLTNYIW